ncbi:serine/threonine protein kinase [Ktedonobacter robiniae]|uniref:serine/threonine protein kinase n=1 Tax=Ktedonobacter robiniae TaxID=2778365 RepID=UPI0019154C36|nr:protein kinase [Ktedonobacter robiniae]
MSQRDTRLIGGIYRTGQILSSDGILTTCTAYNRNTNDVVGLYVLHCPPNVPPHVIQQVLQPLAQRRTHASPHLLHISDWGVDNNRIFIATDPPRGVTLRHAMDNENIDLQRSLDLIHQLALGVKVLHEAHIAALDLRPQFVTVETFMDNNSLTDRVRLDDIGLRELLRALGASNSTASDSLAAIDPRYASPEHLNSQPIGPWSDIYLLGILLFELVTGRAPFVGHTPAETGVMQGTSAVPRMKQYMYNVPDELQAVVDCALSKEPGRRFANVNAFLKALQGVALRQPPGPLSSRRRYAMPTRAAPAALSPAKWRSQHHTRLSRLSAKAPTSRSRCRYRPSAPWPRSRASMPTCATRRLASCKNASPSPEKMSLLDVLILNAAILRI